MNFYFMDFFNFIIIVSILLASITFHEYSHGFVANRLGDPTAKSSGRLTLNPLAHIDIFGTILLPIILFKLTGGRFSFGYAKPIPINPYHFKRPKKDIFWVGLAGPIANFIIAIFLILVLKISNYLFIPEILVEGILINLVLAIFNLIPIPPLDGSRIISAILPYKFSYLYLKHETVGLFAVIFLITTGFLRWFILPTVTFIFSLFKIKVAI